jgi:hypothetical protein
MELVRDYFRNLPGTLGDRWNRFWFQPSDGFDLCVMRWPVGALALIWQLSFTPDLMRWYGPEGWFDGGMLEQWITAQSTLGFSGRLSYLYRLPAGSLWACHVLSSLVLLAFLLGFFTRVASVLSFAVVLSYMHRAPFLGSAIEVILTMLVGYLCLAPCGQALSLDARRSRRYRDPMSVSATIARRLMQVHLVAIYGTMALSKLGGPTPTWWNGEAIWWLTAQPLTRDVDLSALRNLPILLNLWTYGVLMSELAFVLFVWSPLLRPLVMIASAISWISLAVATGSLALPVTMLVANLVFVSSQVWREGLGRQAPAAVRA